MALPSFDALRWEPANTAASSTSSLSEEPLPENFVKGVWTGFFRLQQSDDPMREPTLELHKADPPPLSTHTNITVVWSHPAVREDDHHHHHHHHGAHGDDLEPKRDRPHGLSQWKVKLGPIYSCVRYCFTSPRHYYFSPQGSLVSAPRNRDSGEAALSYTISGSVGFTLGLQKGKYLYVVLRSLEEADELEQFIRHRLLPVHERPPHPQVSTEPHCSPGSSVAESHAARPSPSAAVKKPHGHILLQWRGAPSPAFSKYYISVSRRGRQRKSASVSSAAASPASGSSGSWVYLQRHKYRWWQYIKTKCLGSEPPIPVDLRQVLLTPNAYRDDQFTMQMLQPVNCTADIRVTPAEKRERWLAWLVAKGGQRQPAPPRKSKPRHYSSSTARGEGDEEEEVDEDVVVETSSCTSTSSYSCFVTSSPPVTGRSSASSRLGAGGVHTQPHSEVEGRTPSRSAPEGRSQQNGLEGERAAHRHNEREVRWTQRDSQPTSPLVARSPRTPSGHTQAQHKFYSDPGASAPLTSASAPSLAEPPKTMKVHNYRTCRDASVVPSASPNRERRAKEKKNSYGNGANEHEGDDDSVGGFDDTSSESPSRTREGSVSSADDWNHCFDRSSSSSTITSPTSSSSSSTDDFATHGNNELNNGRETTLSRLCTALPAHVSSSGGSSGSIHAPDASTKCFSNASSSSSSMTALDRLKSESREDLETSNSEIRTTPTAPITLTVGTALTALPLRNEQLAHHVLPTATTLQYDIGFLPCRPSSLQDTQQQPQTISVSHPVMKATPRQIRVEQENRFAAMQAQWMASSSGGGDFRKRHGQQQQVVLGLRLRRDVNT